MSKDSLPTMNDLSRTTAEREVIKAGHLWWSIQKNIKKKAAKGESTYHAEVADVSERVLRHIKIVLKDRGFRTEDREGRYWKNLVVIWSDVTDTVFEQLIRGGQNCSVCGTSAKPPTKTKRRRIVEAGLAILPWLLLLYICWTI